MARESTLKNLVLTLGVITMLSALGLGGMNVLTQEPIAKAQQAKVLAALNEVLPAFDNDPSTDMKQVEVDGEQVKVYMATKEGNPVGAAVESFSPKGFGGRISIMFGFNADGTIKGYSVLNHAETPGLGDKMVYWFQPPQAPVKSVVESLFLFEVKQAARNSNVYGLCPGSEGLTVSKDGGKIDAITAATISSRAFLDAANRAYRVFEQAQGEASNGNAQ